MARLAALRDDCLPASEPSRIPPQDVFLAWLLTLPQGSNRQIAARQEIERIDASSASGAGVTQLRAMFLELAGH